MSGLVTRLHTDDSSSSTGESLVFLIVGLGFVVLFLVLIAIDSAGKHGR